MQNKNLKCGFFEWLDPPMCSRSKQIIPGLLKKINRLENDTKSLSIEGSEDYGENGQYSAVETSVVMKLIATECKKLKLLLVLIVLLVVVILFK